MMRKVLLALCLLLLLTACGAGYEDTPDAELEFLSDTRSVHLTVFADASLTDALEVIAARYEDAHPRIRLRFQFDASGALRTQIQQGASCDLFVSASPEPMDAIDGAFRGDWVKNPESFDLLLPDSRVNLMENQLVLAVPAGNPRNIRTFAHMASLIRQENILLAVPDAADPLGTYAQKIFDNYLLGARPLSRTVTLTRNATETVTRIRNGTADAGIVYRTDAAGLQIVEAADPSVCENVTYCAAVLAESAYTREASAFLDYLTGAEASDYFTRAGFAPLSARSRYSDAPEADGDSWDWEEESPEELWDDEGPEASWDDESPDSWEEEFFDQYGEPDWQ